MAKFLFFANTDWYIYNFRLSTLVRLKSLGHEIFVLSPNGPYGSKFQTYGFKWIIAPMERGGLNIFNEIKLISWIISIVRSEKIDYMHNFTIKCAVYGSIVSRFVDFPGCINSIAGLGYIFISNKIPIRFLRFFILRVMKYVFGGKNVRVIFQNPDDMQFFINLGVVKQSSIFLVPGSGVNCDKFCPAPDKFVLINNNKIVVLLAARMLFDKGVVEYIDAIKIIKKYNYKIEFLLAGSPDFGNPASIPVDLLMDWKSSGLVNWLGQVDDMAKLYKTVDIVVLPSYREGLPKGLIEAAASGLALVATDVPGCREVIQDGINGILVPVKNSELLAEAIVKLYLNADLRVTMGKRAFLDANSKFNENVIIEGTLKVYSDLGFN